MHCWRSPGLFQDRQPELCRGCKWPGSLTASHRSGRRRSRSQLSCPPEKKHTFTADTDKITQNPTGGGVMLFPKIGESSAFFEGSISKKNSLSRANRYFQDAILNLFPMSHGSFHKTTTFLRLLFTDIYFLYSSMKKYLTKTLVNCKGTCNVVTGSVTRTHKKSWPCRFKSAGLPGPHQGRVDCADDPSWTQRHPHVESSSWKRKQLKHSGQLVLRIPKFQTDETLSSMCQAVSPTLVED